MRALHSFIRLSVFGLALATGSLLSCGDKQLQRIETPQGGVKLQYDLTPGASYRGHLRVGNTRQIEGAGTLNQNVECGVQMTVLGRAPDREGHLVKATFTNVQLDWALPASVPISADEFLGMALEQVQGMAVTFAVLSTGEITYMPVPPSDAPDELKAVIQAVLDALESAFLAVPERTLAQGERWTDEQQQGRKGKLGRFREASVTTTFDGMFRAEERDEQWAKLDIQLARKDVITTKEGQRTGERTGKTTAYFSTAGYLAKIESETRDFDPKLGMNFRKVHAQWEKIAAGVSTPEDPATAIQEIDDPCNPDYVGPHACAEVEPAESASEDTDATEPTQEAEAPETDGETEAPPPAPTED